MRIGAFALALLAGAAAPAAAFAQQGTVSGAAGGAVTGALVGGPIGAAVGGVAGAVIGTAIAPPRQVRDYVVQEERPSAVYATELKVGALVPDGVRVYEVPDTQYSYTIVNDRRYIVGKDRKVVEEVR